MEKRDIVQKILREYGIKQGMALEKKNFETQKAYEKSPALKEIDESINRLGYENMHRLIMSKGKNLSSQNDFQKNLDELSKKRKEIIVRDGINPDYNKPVYECSLCSDTGYIENGERCSCFERRMTELYYENSNMGKLIGNADLGEFELGFYSDEKKNGYQSPRDIVKEALEYSKYFCDNFDKDIANIYFYGNTGLGKTFLSTAISKRLMDMGKSVCYARATKVFSLYEEYKFKDYSLKEQIDDLYKSDLLVIDDLGSELITKTGIAFFFDLLNDRLINGKKIIINTNLDPASFSKSYTVRATSRIYESFKIFKFEGDDIRIRKLID